MDSNTQSISITTLAEGRAANGKMLIENAQCELSNNKGRWFVKTPGSVVVSKSLQPLQIRCTHDLYHTTSNNKDSDLNAYFYGNIIFGGIIGIAPDTGTGAGTEYPQEIVVYMRLKND